MHAPHALLVVCESGVFHVCRRAYHMEVIWNCRYGVSVAHPHLRALVEALEDGRCRVDGLEVGAAVFACSGLFDVASKGIADELCSIADAEHGVVPDDLCEVYLEGFLVVYGVGAATQDDTYDGRVIFWKLVVRQNLTKRIQLAHASTYELCGLRTKVEDDDFLLHIMLIM